MNGYICFYKGRQLEVLAETSYAAQQAATAKFQAGQRAKIKSYEVTPVLAERQGEPVVHNTAGV